MKHAVEMGAGAVICRPGFIQPFEGDRGRDTDGKKVA
jgi:hypothetical protein